MTVLGLGLAGLSEQTIKDLDANLPALQRIAAAAKQAEPLLTPLFPLLARAWPDIVTVTPLIQELIAFAKQKETE
jgi:hypothetical protein